MNRLAKQNINKSQAISFWSIECCGWTLVLRRLVRMCEMHLFLLIRFHSSSLALSLFATTSVRLVFQGNKYTLSPSVSTHLYSNRTYYYFCILFIPDSFSLLLFLFARTACDSAYGKNAWISAWVAYDIIMVRCRYECSKARSTKWTSNKPHSTSTS